LLIFRPFIVLAGGITFMSASAHLSPETPVVGIKLWRDLMQTGSSIRVPGTLVTGALTIAR
jgi:hypothetical protein